MAGQQQNKAYRDSLLCKDDELLMIRYKVRIVDRLPSLNIQLTRRSDSLCKPAFWTQSESPSRQPKSTSSFRSPAPTSFPPKICFSRSNTRSARRPARDTSPLRFPSSLTPRPDRRLAQFSQTQGRTAPVCSRCSIRTPARQSCRTLECSRKWSRAKSSGLTVDRTLFPSPRRTI